MMIKKIEQILIMEEPLVHTILISGTGSKNLIMLLGFFNFVIKH